MAKKSIGSQGESVKGLKSGIREIGKALRKMENLYYKSSGIYLPGFYSCHRGIGNILDSMGEVIEHERNKKPISKG